MEHAQLNTVHMKGLPVHTGKLSDRVQHGFKENTHS